LFREHESIFISSLCISKSLKSSSQSRKTHPPKAEARGSNPLWSANYFNDLARITAAAIVGQHPHSTHILGKLGAIWPNTPTSSKTPGVAAIFEFRGRRGRAVTPGAGRRGSCIRAIRPVCEATQADGAVGGLVPRLIPPSRRKRSGAALFRVRTAAQTGLRPMHAHR